MANYRAKEILDTCPFDPVHRIVPGRLAAHITKCRKNHPNADVKTCPFNATHIIKTPLFQSHIVSCPDRAIVERDMYRCKAVHDQQENKKKMLYKAAEVPIAAASGEDWDSEVVVNSYNPEEYLLQREFTRPPPAGMGKAARREWRKKEEIRVRSIKEGRPINHLVHSQSSSASSGSTMLQERDDSPMQSQKKLRHPRIAANIGLYIGNEQKEIPDEVKKIIIKQKRILEKRLFGIKKLQAKVKEGHILTNEEKVKVSKKQDTEKELASLLEGVDLDN